MQTKVLLVNLYAPNIDDAEFAKKLLSSLPFLNSHLLILGGDINCVFDPLLDRSNPLNPNKSFMSQTFSFFMKMNGYVDPWRSRKPNRKKLSFLSCIILIPGSIIFFIDPTLNSCVVYSDYLSIIISDHAPLQLDIQLNAYKHSLPLWIPDSSVILNSVQRDIVAFTSLIARRTLLLHWKSARYPSISLWLKHMTFFFIKLQKKKIHHKGLYRKILPDVAMFHTLLLWTESVTQLSMSACASFFIFSIILFLFHCYAFHQTIAVEVLCTNLVSWGRVGDVLFSSWKKKNL